MTEFIFVTNIFEYSNIYLSHSGWFVCGVREQKNVFFRALPELPLGGAKLKGQCPNAPCMNLRNASLTIDVKKYKEERKQQKSREKGEA